MNIYTRFCFGDGILRPPPELFDFEQTERKKKHTHTHTNEALPRRWGEPNSIVSSWGNEENEEKCSTTLGQVREARTVIRIEALNGSLLSRLNWIMSKVKRSSSTAFFSSSCFTHMNAGVIKSSDQSGILDREKFQKKSQKILPRGLFVFSSPSVHCGTTVPIPNPTL